MLERCRLICGSIDNCFISNNKQVQCIADMVINKAFGIRALIEITLAENHQDRTAENLTEALKSINELTNWAKFLQIAHDLRLLNSLSLEKTTNEKRKEIRYPLHEKYQKYIGLYINVSGSWIPALPINFSQRGIQFKCSMMLNPAAVHECVLSTLQGINKTVSFNVKIRHCRKQEREFLVGATIDKIADELSFNFFENVYDFITEISRQQELRS